jgi:membrane-bound metal-dependent hydrolase YbcI (DUF457 family)
MANNKSKSTRALAAHVAAYSSVLFLGLLAGNLFFSWWTLAGLVKYSAINGSLHFLVDALTSRGTSWAHRMKREKLFFTTIGFDQFLHTALLVKFLPW